jgi:hypothetical protein
MTAPLIDRLTQQLKAKGMGDLKAKDEALMILNKRGHIDDQGELTAAGRKRQAMGADGRAKDRAAKASDGRHKPADYAYDAGTNRATLKPKARGR